MQIKALLEKNNKQKSTISILKKGEMSPNASVSEAANC